VANKKEDLSILHYCVKTLDPHIADLKKAAQNILKRDDIEDVHDLRVASRRIRSTLLAFADHLPKKQLKNWMKDTRAITKAYGKVRDLDVQLDLINQIYSETDDSKLQPGIRRIKLRLEQKRQTLQENTAHNTQALLESEAIVDLSNWVNTTLEDSPDEELFSSGLYQLGYKQIQNQLDEFLFYEVFIFDSRRIDELHSMRISAKKLRYSLEIFSELYSHETDFTLKITRQAQDYLGEIHDCDVWIEFLPLFMQKEYERIKSFYGYTRPYRRIRPGIEYFIANRKEKREKLYQTFLKDWKNWKMKETWLNLRKVIFLTSLETQSHPPQPEIEEQKSEDMPNQNQIESGENPPGE